MTLFVVVGALVGAIAGSFIATLCIRWPRGEQATRGRSHCDSCQRRIRPHQMIPLVSAIVTRGKCAICGALIPRIHFFVELACALLAGLALYLKPDLGGVALATFWLLLVGPAVLDARYLWLPGRLLLVLAITGLGLGTLALGAPLIDRLIGGAAGYLSLWLIGAAYNRFRGREGLGGGDPKLFGAICLWTGWQSLPIMLLVASSLGIVAAVALRKSGDEPVPLGSLLAVAAIVWSAVAAAQAY